MTNAPMRVAQGLILALSACLLSTASFAETFPDFLGKQVGEAEHLAGKAGLKVTIHKIDSLEKRGKVLLQIPAGGIDVGADRRLFLEVSDGIVVPDLSGKRLAEAQSALKAIGLSFASSDRRHDGLTKGTVATQIPGPNARIDPPKEIVFLDIVGGRYVRVPEVKGKLLSDALAVINSAELKAQEDPINSAFAKQSTQESRKDCNTINVSKAVAQRTTPEAGTEIYPGLSVLVIFSVEDTTKTERSTEAKCNRPPREKECPPRLCK